MADHSITREHKDYKARKDQWVVCRDALEGEDAIKKRGEKYLPKLGGQDSGSYGAYKRRGSFFAASGRTQEGLVGAIMRKDPEVEWPEKHEEMLEVIGASGETLKELILTALDEVIGVGRYGLLIDAQSAAIPALGLAVAPGEVQQLPFVATYTAETIINWEERVINQRRVPVSVTLRESETVYGETRGGGETSKEVVTYRRLILGAPLPSTPEEEKEQEDLGVDGWLAKWGLVLEDFAEGPIYFQEIWEKRAREHGQGDEYIRTEVLVIRMLGGRLLRFIPFIFLNPGGTRPPVEKPPLLDLVNVNLSHWRNSADLEHGRHFTALPTAWAAGFDVDGEMRIGSAVAWVTDNEKARAGFLEFTGKGLNHLAEGMRDKERHMAVLGARLLEEQKTGVEAAETVRMRMAGEGSVLARMALSVSAGFTKVLGVLAEWIALNDATIKEVHVKLNTDFQLQGMEPTMLTALMAATQTGQISWSTFFWNAQRGEIIPPGVSEEEESDLIEAGIPGQEAGDVITDADEKDGNLDNTDDDPDED